MKIVARFKLDFPVPAKIAIALLIRFPKFPPKIMAPSLKGAPLILEMVGVAQVLSKTHRVDIESCGIS
jgi:hypothetical protein